MRARTVLLTLAALFAAVAVSFATDDAFMGTWKLDEAKSTVAPGQEKNDVSVWTMEGDNVTVTGEQVAPDGQRTQTKRTGKLDGKDYPFTQGMPGATAAITRLDDHTLTEIVKRYGKVVLTIGTIISADGRTRTLTLTTTDATGRKITSIRVFDKQ